MEKLVLTGTVCFCVGLTVGLILGAVVMALAVAAKKSTNQRRRKLMIVGVVSMPQWVIAITAR